MGGIVKTLRRSNSLSRSIFSTAGSFGREWPFHSESVFPEPGVVPRRLRI